MSAPLAFLLLLVAQPPSHAVLAVGAAPEPSVDEIPRRAAAGVRERLEARGARVLRAEEVAERMRSLAEGERFSMHALRERLQAAEDAFAALDTSRSIEILEEALRDLGRDAAFDAEKKELLEKTRIRAASRLMGLAGPEEKGTAETPLGARALSHLVDAVRANPTLELSPKEYPPKLRRLLDLAKERVESAGHGSVHVDSVPEGASVFLEGREVGATPLRLEEAVPRGRHRVWLELGGAKSAVHWLEVGEAPAKLSVDLAFEGSLWPEGPGLVPVRGQTIDEEVAAKVADLLEVDQLVLVGHARYDDASWLYGAMFSRAERQTLRRGAVRLERGEVDAAAIDRLSAFLLSGDAEGLDPKAVPPSILPEAAAVAEAAPDAAESEADTNWLLVGGGIAAGAVALGLAAGGVAAALLLAEPKEPVGHFDFEVAR